MRAQPEVIRDRVLRNLRLGTNSLLLSTTAIAGGMIVPIKSCVFVFQNKSITQVDFESIGLLFEHGLQWSF